MFKKIAFCSFILALLLGAGNSFAQPPGFTIASPDVKGIELPEGTKVELQNAADLTAEELKAALEKSSCAAESGEKNLDACFACVGLNCAGPCYRIPCGNYANAKGQIPPQPGFRSFVPGCTTTFVSTCSDLGSGCVTPPCPPNPVCQLFAFAYPGSKVCINYNGPTPLQSVGCVTQ